MPRRFLSLVALCLGALSVAAAEPVVWLTDLDEGIKVAKAEKKAILVDFTGSDWCGWCIRLKKEVFDQKEFAAVTKDFVLVELDYPQKKKQSAEQKEKNKAWAEKFAIEGFPTILLMDSQGEPFAQTGYQEGGPVKYLAHLATLLKDNNSQGKAKFAQGKKDEVVVRGYGDELEKLISPHLDKKDLAGAEAAIAKFLGEKKNLVGAARVTLAVNARVGSVQACKPGDHAAVLKVLDEIIADNPAEFTTELKEFRAQVAAAQAAQKSKK